MDLIEAIRDWPVIVQGALGSFAFWLVLRIATSAYSAISKTYAERSRRTRVQRLTDERLLIYANLGGPYEAGHVASLIWYRASRRVVNALLWITLGLLVGSFVPYLSAIGYAGAIYYLIAAKLIVDPYRHKASLEERLDEVNTELSELDPGEGEESESNNLDEDA